MSRHRNHNSVSEKSIGVVTIGLVLALQLFLVPNIFINPVLSQISEFGSNIQITDGSSPYSDQVEPTMTILSDGQILVGWKEADSHNGGGRRVGFSRSLDGGMSFTPNILMNRIDPGNRQSDPWLISDSEDTAYFVWIEFNDIYLNDPPEGIGVARSSDAGENWEVPVNAANTPHFDDKETACIDSNGTVYIVWDHLEQDSGYSTIDWDMRFTRSINGTEPFSPTKTLDVHALFPYIHCSPNNTLYVSMVNVSDWQTDEYFETIEIIRSVNGGISWSEPIVIPTGTPTVDLIQVLDTDSQENLYLAYSAGPADAKNIYLINSTNGGRTWNTPVKVNDDVDSSNNLRMVEMYIGVNDTIHIVWLDTRLGEYNIFYSYSTDGGTTFSEDERISEEGFSFSFERPGDYFCIRQDPVTGDMCIVWTDGRNGDNHDIFFARQGLFLPDLPPVWPLIIAAAAFLVIILVVLIILVRRNRM